VRTCGDFDLSLNAQNLTNPQNIPNNLPNDFSVGEIRPIYETSNSAQDN